MFEVGDTAVDMALKAGCQEAVVLLEARGGKRGEQLKEGSASDHGQTKVEERDKGWSCRIS